MLQYASSSSSSEPERESASDTTLDEEDIDNTKTNTNTNTNTNTPNDSHDDNLAPNSLTHDSQFPAYPVHLLSACSAAGRAMCQFTQTLLVDKPAGSQSEC
jgi:hypothetical protein